MVDMELVNANENPDTRRKKFVVGKTKPRERNIRDVINRKDLKGLTRASWKIGIFRKIERELVA